MGILGGGKRSAPPVATTAAACSELRSAYHDCFNRWYSDKFSKGEWHKEECTAQWNNYRSCLQEHLEDKHLRKILLESQNSDASSKTD
ncbi:hypothetical protein FCM35_KLT00615 [Carex littledalei]|uniref:Uncharacterized protein n=1 Tax=Carex littledalei TaxID=544730 RepID=A0A833RMI2_9POAL|nr:hypothetical protein FCM35_KLT00615 [Carex littledalei]